MALLGIHHSIPIPGSWWVLDPSSSPQGCGTSSKSHPRTLSTLEKWGAENPTTAPGYWEVSGAAPGHSQVLGGSLSSVTDEKTEAQ
jgi:hypothetical protein